ncbi:uncharacterized protein L203_101895 [Cryptococcus depauperatus CBS 7841]|uniref:protein-tyrosine-phosphatase n=1 Tax=Cryptococcus depauperatus CBS 7841 TaxID=1295531 RepID=A0A1E3IJP8_9TREE|nr:hypothetical protein L203_03135 [Cryptococcus depauperatus CBS 7841]
MHQHSDALPRPLTIQHRIPSPTRQPLTAPLLQQRDSKSPIPRRRPSPLVLGKAKETMGMDEDWQAQRKDADRAQSVTAVSEDLTLASEFQDLSLLRKTAKQNRPARPVGSPLPDSDSGSSIPSPDRSCFPNGSLHTDESNSISIVQVLDKPDMLVMDTRPLGLFLDSHLPQSISISIPTLLSKRFQKTSSQSITWQTLSAFVSTQEGRHIFENVDSSRVEAAVISDKGDEVGIVVWGIMKSLLGDKRVKLVRGGWASVLNDDRAKKMLVSGELPETEPKIVRTSPQGMNVLPPPKSAPAYDVPYIPPVSARNSSPKNGGVKDRPSLPSLRPSGAKRELPSLSVRCREQGTYQRQTPKLSLNLDRPLRSATLGPTYEVPPTPGGFLCARTKPLRSPGLSLNIPPHSSHRSREPTPNSFQTLCHEQSKMPPSPSTFHDIGRIKPEGEGKVLRIDAPHASGSDSVATPTPRPPNNQLQITDSPPTCHPQLLAPVTATRGTVTSASFQISTILPSFLYLGPDITSEADVRALLDLGVKRILNVAIECDDDQGLRLKERFKYQRVPMRDIVEENGVGKGMRSACDFLDDARLHSAPTYVHCQAGKSRSVTVVLAYLIHANAWTLNTSYAYVAERRKGISPNIGFVAELMQFEEAELGLKQSAGVHGDGSGHDSSAGGGGGGGRRGNGRGGIGREIDEDKGGRYMRESLPPTWSSSVDTYSRPAKIATVGGDDGQEEEKQARYVMGDEREVRKNGVWVHHRRAPVDRTTLQPGRRVSKAGLESLRPLVATTISSTPLIITTGLDGLSDGTQQVQPDRLRPSPRPSPGARLDGHAMTPAGDGPLKWI